MKTAVLVLLAALAQAPPAQHPDPASARARLAALQGQLAQVDQQLDSLRKRRKGILVDLQDISLRRDRIRAQEEGARLRRDEAQEEVQRILVDQDRIRRDLKKLQAQLRRQVRWMHALGPYGDLSFLTGSRDFEAFLRNGRMMAWWRLQERRRLEDIHRLRGNLDQREKELKESSARLAQEEREAAQLQASLRVNQERLEDFLLKVQTDEKAKRQMQAELAEEALQLERLMASLSGKGKGEAFVPASAFASLRGELPQPVEGQLAEGFGEQIHPRYRTRTERTGILVSAPLGVPVAAVADGRVAFADYYQSYGPMIILDHGGGWFTLYTHLQGVLLAKGEVLRAGERVGYVGESADGPRLGFEIRFQKQPQDPQKWFKRRYR
ncbi:MAG: peptidoglycan DD-metalloendopeptidase family protein [Acidobacteria bacterium]|nr:peptidoglycan DD-metalloendopeptidase family protein [Acidobacteriota bacterium]